ncbi:hypothetical protein L1887_39320 [Cichorium endivia]|nr:hypothetical protein L1887_39320 [Cichorium endivia]
MTTGDSFISVSSSFYLFRGYRRHIYSFIEHSCTVSLFQNEPNPFRLLFFFISSAFQALLSDYQILEMATTLLFRNCDQGYQDKRQHVR